MSINAEPVEIHAMRLELANNNRIIQEQDARLATLLSEQATHLALVARLRADCEKREMELNATMTRHIDVQRSIQNTLVEIQEIRQSTKHTNAMKRLS